MLNNKNPINKLKSLITRNLNIDFFFAIDYSRFRLISIRLQCLLSGVIFEQGIITNTNEQQNRPFENIYQAFIISFVQKWFLSSRQYVMQIQGTLA